MNYAIGITGLILATCTVDNLYITAIGVLMAFALPRELA